MKTPFLLLFLINFNCFAGRRRSHRSRRRSPYPSRRDPGEFNTRRYGKSTPPLPPTVRFLRPPRPRHYRSMSWGGTESQSETVNHQVVCLRQARSPFRTINEDDPYGVIAPEISVSQRDLLDLPTETGTGVYCNVEFVQPRVRNAAVEITRYPSSNPDTPVPSRHSPDPVPPLVHKNSLARLEAVSREIADKDKSPNWWKHCCLVWSGSASVSCLVMGALVLYVSLGGAD